MIRNVNFFNGCLNVMTELGSIAELSRIDNLDDFEDNFKEINFKGLIFWFNRIKAKKEGIGEGRLLMKEIIKICDKEKINIINYLNPYGKRDLKSLKRFFINSDFIEFKNKNNNSTVMIRKFKQ